MWATDAVQSFVIAKEQRFEGGPRQHAKGMRRPHNERVIGSENTSATPRATP